MLCVGAAIAEANSESSCRLLCAPELELEPTLSIGNIVNAPRVEDVMTGESRRQTVDPVFQLTLAAGVPTQLSFVKLTLETILVPFAEDNFVEFEAELNLLVLTKQWTGGWVAAHVDVIDQLSPRARPAGSSAYTQKLDLELDVALYAFNWLRSPQWLREVSFEASFDYLATGLPRRGDVVDGERYLDDATGWSLSLVIVLPLAPLDRS